MFNKFAKTTKEKNKIVLEYMIKGYRVFAEVYEVKKGTKSWYIVINEI